jgi:hypothetical protein
VNRTEEIRTSLARATQEPPIPPDGGFVAAYRDHVAYLLEVLRSLGDHDLHERLREQSRQLARLARTVRRQRKVIAVLATVIAVGAAAVLATTYSDAARRTAEAPGPVIELAIDDATGAFCTPWEPPSKATAAGRIAGRRRWCVDCVGCLWYRDMRAQTNGGYEHADE